jgi:type II secretory pathway predicted ATPase ExeA
MAEEGKKPESSKTIDIAEVVEEILEGKKVETPEHKTPNTSSEKDISQSVEDILNPQEQPVQQQQQPHIVSHAQQAKQIVTHAQQTDQIPQPAISQPVQTPVVSVAKPMSVLEWLAAMRWKTNPFIFNINPSLFVGYRAQTERLQMALDEKHKFTLILGPTGSGKTTLLRWLQTRIRSDTLYIGKPPHRAEEFVTILNEKYQKPWYAFWAKSLSSVYQIPGFLNEKLRGKHLVILLVENMSIVLSGLPVFEDQLHNNLETFVKRVTAKISLLSLTKEDTKELIIRRVKNAGGSGNEFTDSVIEKIYEYTGGFPREVLRVCDEIVNNAMMKGSMHVEFDVGGGREEIKSEAQTQTPSIVEKMTPMQREVLELLSKRPSTPGQIADLIDLTKYKSRQHAVRSVNNVVKALQEDGYLERKKEDKAYVYSLAPRISTLFVKR